MALTVRRLIALTLLALFGLPFATSLLAMSPKHGGDTPLCCRRAGRHHCTGMDGRGTARDGEASLSAPAGTCPYAAVLVLPVQMPAAPGVPLFRGIRAAVLTLRVIPAPSRPASSTDSKGSPRKRGPPSLHLS